MLFLVEKWIPPSRSEIAEIGQKTEGILGLKSGLAKINLLVYIIIFVSKTYYILNPFQEILSKKG
jgi:hypothetical protein